MKSVASCFSAALLLLVLGGCGCKVELEPIGESLRAVTDRNMLLLRSESGDSVDISYSATIDGHVNSVVRRRMATLCLLELGRMVVMFDSLDCIVTMGKCGTQVGTCGGIRCIRHDYSTDGAEYLRIENRGRGRVAVAGTEGLRKRATSSEESWRPDALLATHPAPLYRGVPILYLLRPDLAPNRTFNVEVTLKEKASGRG